MFTLHGTSAGGTTAPRERYYRCSGTTAAVERYYRLGGTAAHTWTVLPPGSTLNLFNVYHLELHKIPHHNASTYASCKTLILCTYLCLSPCVYSMLYRERSVSHIPVQ